MAKKITARLKMKIPAGQATAAPPVGSTLGQYGVNIMDFVNPFNQSTREQQGEIVTVHVTVYEDRTIDFRVVSIPTEDRIRAELGIEKGSGRSNIDKVEKKLTQSQLTKIAEAKARDMNTEDIAAIKKMVAGTARSMGVELE